MTTIIGIAGSLRKGSYNAALLRAAARSMPAGSTLEQATIAGIPLYDADVEAQGMPPAVTSLKDRVAAADLRLFLDGGLLHFGRRGRDRADGDEDAPSLRVRATDHDRVMRIGAPGEFWARSAAGQPQPAIDRRNGAAGLAQARAGEDLGGAVEQRQVDRRGGGGEEEKREHGRLHQGS